MVKLQYYSQDSAHNLSSILMGSGRGLKADSAFHPSKVSKMNTQLTRGKVLISLLCCKPPRAQESALVLWGKIQVETITTTIMKLLTIHILGETDMMEQRSGTGNS